MSRRPIATALGAGVTPEVATGSWPNHRAPLPWALIRWPRACVYSTPSTVSTPSCVEWGEGVGWERLHLPGSKPAWKLALSPFGARRSRESPVPQRGFFLAEGNESSRRLRPVAIASPNRPLGQRLGHGVASPSPGLGVQRFSFLGSVGHREGIGLRGGSCCARHLGRTSCSEGAGDRAKARVWD